MRLNPTIYIASMPRSGSSYLAQLLSGDDIFRLKLCPLFSYELKHVKLNIKKESDWENLFDKAFITE